VARLNAAMSTELPDEARAWLRALRLRATLDWRLLDSVKSPSLLERLERMLAQSRTTRKYDADRSRESGRSPDAEDVPDWGWRRLHLGFSLEEGSALAERTWFATYLEALIVLRGEAYPEPRPDLVKALLRQPSISCLVRTRHGAEVQVIDRGTWSAFYQRELAYTSMQATYYFAHMRRAKYEARNFRVLVDRALGGLPLYEVTRRLTAQSDSEYRNSMVNLSQLVGRDPSLVSYRSWAIMARRPPAGLQRPQVMPLETSWFPERFPAGTGYDIDRLDVPTDDFRILRLIDELRRLSPWSPTVVSHWIAAHCRPACSDSELRGAYYPLAEYHPTFAIQLAYARGDRTSEPLQRACNLDGEYCWYLGDWLLSHNRVREAAVVFEQYAQRVRDGAGAARLQWLARYYAEQRRTADALWIAELAATTPSADGVRALATVLYQTGRYDEAELLYRHLRTRYGSDTDLLAYFIREARRRSEPTGARSSEFEHLMRRHFPSGLREQKLSEFSSKPDVGLSVHRPGWRQSTVGLHDGDVIVAVDNVRVSTLDQWRVLYQTSFQRDLQVIVWRNGSYQSVVAPFWCYGYALDLRPYRP
jgi:hypothetical protein